MSYTDDMVFNFIYDLSNTLAIFLIGQEIDLF